MIRSVRSRVLSATRSEFGRNAIWFTGLSAIERVIAVVQTVVIARILGITDYGVYGLLFGTIGFVASVAGLQMGLTATVYVAQYWVAEPPRAWAVIAIVSRFGWIVSVLFIAFASPFTDAISQYLLGSEQYRLPTLLGIVFVAATIIAGIQDGVAQGLEMFKSLAWIKILASVATLLAMVPAAQAFGLTGVLTVVLLGLAMRYVVLNRQILRSVSMPPAAEDKSGISWLDLLKSFALPSMTVSLGVGFVMWMGIFLLSRQPNGFNEVAIATTGVQWRGPILLLAASLGGVAIPAFSRLHALGNADRAITLRRNLLIANFAIALAITVILVAGSGTIMKLYGDDFANGQITFALIVLSAMPTVLANVFLQELVGKAQMWWQLLVHGPYLIIVSIAFFLLVPQYRASGYAVSLLLGGMAILASVLIAERICAGRLRHFDRAAMTSDPRPRQ